MLSAPRSLRFVVVLIAGAMVLGAPGGAAALPTGGPSSAIRPDVSLAPEITFVDGTPEERRTVLDAVGLFGAAGLSLPALRVRLHPDGKAGCHGNMGYFAPTPPTIDLCFDRRFLALHELAHAWEWSNVSDDIRARFVVQSDADAWDGDDVPHSHRGVERAADTIAFGLLPGSLSLSEACDPMLDGFALLTGRPSPRLAAAPACSAS